MFKRLIAGLLWFLATLCSYELIWYVAGVPRVLGPVLGFVIGSAVAIDPRGWVWARKASADQIPRRVVQSVNNTATR